MNIGGVSNDSFHRYTRSELQIKVEKPGTNGQKTVILNIEEVAKQLNVPPEWPTRFFSYELGGASSFTKADKGGRTAAVVKGHHTKEQCEKALDKLIKLYVLCPNCKLPELLMKRSKFRCASCGHRGVISTGHKMDKFIADFAAESKNQRKEKPHRKEKPERNEKLDCNEKPKQAKQPKDPEAKSGLPKDASPRPAVEILREFLAKNDSHDWAYLAFCEVKRIGLARDYDLKGRIHLVCDLVDLKDACAQIERLVPLLKKFVDGSYTSTILLDYFATRVPGDLAQIVSCLAGLVEEEHLKSWLENSAHANLVGNE